MHGGVLAVALALALAGCVTSSGGNNKNSGGQTGSTGSTKHKVTLTFANWADAEDATKPGIEAVVKGFERSHPTITIKMEAIAFSDIGHQVLLEAQSGNAPDVAEMQGNYTFSLAEAQQLMTLKSYATSAYTKTIIPQELALGTIGGQLQAVPWTVAPFALWFNKTTLKRAGLAPTAPTTAKQLLTDLAAIKAKEPGVIPIGIDVTNREYGLDSSWGFMKSFGAAPFSGSTPTATTPQMQNYLTFMRTIGNNGYTQLNKKSGEFRPIAADNKVGFMWDGPYPQGVIQSTTHVSDANFYQTWGVAPMPTGTTGKSYSTPTDHQLVIMKSSKNQAAAWEFIKYLTTSSAGLDYVVKSENSLPALTKLTGTTVADRAKSPIYQAFSKQVIPTVIRPPWGSNYSKAYSPIMAGVQNAMTSSTSIASVAAQIQSQLKTALR